MKTFELKENEQFKDKDILTTVCSSHAAKGITVSEMRVLVKVIDKLEDADDTLTLEDAEHAALLMRLKAFPFSTATQLLVDLEDRVAGAEKIPSEKPD